MTVPRSLSPLPHRETQIGERGRAVSEAKLVASAHAMHEVLLGVPCPGAGKRIYATHDHCYRGIALPRNLQFCYDQGHNVQKLSWQNGDAINWWSPMEGTTGQSLSYETSTSKRFNPYEHHSIRAYATPNVDSDNIAVSGNPCYLVADLLIASDYACSLRFYNVDRQEVSATAAVPAVASLSPPAEVTAYLPVIGGRVNQYIVEMQCSTTGNQVNVYQLSVAETRTHSQPASQGTQLYTVASRP